MEAHAASTEPRCAVVARLLTIANRFEELEKVAAWLKESVQQCRLAPDIAFKLDIVLNEALPNIISYAYPDQQERFIQIKLERYEAGVALEILDDGQAFDPFFERHKPDAQSLEEAPIQGRGIHLIKSYTDIQEYKRADGINSMRIGILIPAAG